MAQLVKNPPAMGSNLGLISGLGRSSEEGNGYPHQYSGLENSKDCIVHEVTESQTRLSDFHYGFGGKTTPEEKGPSHHTGAFLMST